MNYQEIIQEGTPCVNLAFMSTGNVFDDSIYVRRSSWDSIHNEYHVMCNWCINNFELVCPLILCYMLCVESLILTSYQTHNVKKRYAGMYGLFKFDVGFFVLFYEVF